MLLMRASPAAATTSRSGALAPAATPRASTTAAHCRHATIAGSQRASNPRAIAIYVPHCQSVEPGFNYDALAELKRVTAFTEEAQKMARIQTLQFAMANSGLNRFEFQEEIYDDDGNFVRTDIIDSEDEAFDIINAFMKGWGWWIDEYYLDYGKGENNGQTRAAFRKALGTHIHSLTGVEPRFKKGHREGYDRKQFCIYYK